MFPGEPSSGNATIGKRVSLAIIGATLAAIAIVIACSPVPQGTPTPMAAPTTAAVVEPVDRGSGVFYFPATGEAYIAALTKFYEGNGRHCDLQGFTTDGYGVPKSFILHCHDLAIEAQDVTRE